MKNIILTLFVLSITACAAPSSGSKDSSGESIFESSSDTLPAMADVTTPPITPKFQRDYTRAISLIQSKKNRSAITALTRLTQNYPQFAGPHVNLGLIYFKAKQYSKAQKAFTKALVLNPNNAISHNHVGIMQRKKGKFKEALTSYRLAVRSNPDYAGAHLNLGILYDIYLSNLPKALEHYQRYQKITGEKDKKVSNWIIDIKRRIKSS